MTSIYENAKLQRIMRGILRPGGLELTKTALSLLLLPKGGGILDVGCGLGASLQLFRQYGYTSIGLDLSYKLTAEASVHSNVVQGSAEWLPFQSHSFDAVFFECVLSLLPDKKRALAECFRVLKEGGRLVVADLYAREEKEKTKERDAQKSTERKSVLCCMRDAGAESLFVRQFSSKTTLTKSVQSIDSLGRNKFIQKNLYPFPKTGFAHSCTDGALPLPDLLTLIKTAGFVIQHEQDCSRELGALVAQMVWELGSADALFQILRGSKAVSCSGKKNKYGYILLIGKKERTLY